MVMGLVADLDHSIVRSLNRWFSGSTFRIDLAKALAVWPLYAVIGLAVLAWLAGWGDESDRRILLLLGLGGAVLALIGNNILGSHYYRARPFVAMPSVHLLIRHSRETSLYSDHLAVAGGLTAGVLAARRWVLGSIAVVATIALAIGRIGAGLHYPSDCAAAVAAAVVGMALLLPVRPLLRPPLRFAAGLERRIFKRGGT